MYFTAYNNVFPKIVTPKNKKILSNFALNCDFVHQGLKWRKCVRTDLVDIPLLGVRTAYENFRHPP